MPEDLQQQIADGARPLARVGDVIAHGEAIPANVRTVEDKMGDVHRRRADDPDLWGMNESAGDNGEEEDGEDHAPWPTSEVATYAPLKVVEVDPEPQPAEDPREELIRKVMAELGVEHPGDVLEALEKRFNALVMARRSREENRRERLRAEAEVQRLYARLNEATEALTELKPAESGQVVLSLPQVPNGAVALVDRIGRSWTRSESGANWEQRDPDGVLSNWRTLGNLLGDFGPLTPEFAPPREPRTWPKLDSAPDDLKAFTGASGKVYMRLTTGVEAERRPLYHPADAGFESHNRAAARPLSHWQEIDGPVREVLT